MDRHGKRYIRMSKGSKAHKGRNTAINNNLNITSAFSGRFADKAGSPPLMHPLAKMNIGETNVIVK